MREIKFRAWYHTEKRMIDWNEMQDNSIESLDTYFRGVFGDVSPVMQYTGLKDKNGKEIYEGDIYHMGDPNITYTVVWHDAGLIGKQNGSNSYAGLSHWQDRIEVIGNIYEHKHFLEEKKHV